MSTFDWIQLLCGLLGVSIILAMINPSNMFLRVANFERAAWVVIILMTLALVQCDRMEDGNATSVRSAFPGQESYALPSWGHFLSFHCPLSELHPREASSRGDLPGNGLQPRRCAEVCPLRLQGVRGIVPIRS